MSKRERTRVLGNKILNNEAEYQSNLSSVFDPSQLNKFIAYLWTPHSVIGTRGMKMNGHSRFPLGSFCLIEETHTWTDHFGII